MNKISDFLKTKAAHVILILVLLVLAGFLVATVSLRLQIPKKSDILLNKKNDGGILKSESAKDKIIAEKPPFSGGYKAAWISYLEFQSIDFSSEEAFRAEMTEIFKNCSELGLNTVIVQVRPFGDALYDSKIYPTSHIITGTQGDELAFDPLEIMVSAAHAENLRIEAWINPYRVRINENVPPELDPKNPGNNEDLILEIDGGIYYNPALVKVREMVVWGVSEIIENYDVDGIHLDDYFYPTTDLTVDREDYEVSGTELTHEQWRRENVNILVRDIYKTVKAYDENLTFGISPQGNNSNNYDMQYSDVCLWMSEEGYIDYIMPQIYWGFNFVTSYGDDSFGFKTICETWASYERHSSVSLYIGLGAYLIGEDSESGEWRSGENLTNMVTFLYENRNIDGFALFRYDFLFKNGEYSSLAEKEVNNLKNLILK